MCGFADGSSGKGVPWEVCEQPPKIATPGGQGGAGGVSAVQHSTRAVLRALHTIMSNRIQY